MNLARILAEGKALAATPPGQRAAGSAREMALQLIDVYDMVYNSDESRRMAADLVADLARDDQEVIDLVIQSAARYTEKQFIDDASPYSPNSFEVLSRIGRGHQKVISFLRQTIADHWGIPRWAAIDALCVLGDSEGDQVLHDILSGKYPPRKLDLDLQLETRRIAAAKGSDFIIERNTP